LQGFNGRTNTFIDGNRAVTASRSIYISNALAVVRGFCISNGGNYNQDGGGVYCKAGKLYDCFVTLNIASNGGGVCIDAGLVTNCTFSNNTAIGKGGGILITNNGTLTASDVFSNTATLDGGGIYMYDGLVTNCFIAGNTSTNGSGGGAFNKSGTITQCQVMYNQAGRF
jgi:predicted outer membrane repeat protein